MGGEGGGGARRGVTIYLPFTGDLIIGYMDPLGL